METYRLSSKLIDEDKEFLIQTFNDANVSCVESTVFINGQETERVRSSHPSELTADEVLSLVKRRHESKKTEVETVLQTYRDVLTGEDAESMFRLGTALFFRRLLTEARRLFETALEISPDMHRARNYLGRTYLAMGDVNTATQLFQAAIEKQSGYADYHFNLAEAYMQSDMPRQAITEFEKAVKINIYYGDAYFGLALALLLNAIRKDDAAYFTGVLSRTIDAIKRAIIIDKEYDTELCREGLTILQRTELEPAFGVLLKAFRARRSQRNQELADYYMRYVYYRTDIAEPTLAARVSFLEKEIEKHPDYADLQVELSHCHLLLARNAIKKSLTYHRRSLELSPSMQDVDARLVEVERADELLEGILNMSASRR